MKRVLTLFLLTAAFLGGYYLGRLPNSPDIFAWGRRTFDQAVDMGRQAERYLSEDSRAERDSAVDGRVPPEAYLFHHGGDDRR